MGGEEDEDCWSAAPAGEVEDAAGDLDSVTAVVPPAVSCDGGVRGQKTGDNVVVVADGCNTATDPVMDSKPFLVDDHDVLLVQKPSGAHLLVEVVQFDVLWAVATNYFLQRLSRREKTGYAHGCRVAQRYCVRYIVMWRTGGG